MTDRSQTLGTIFTGDPTQLLRTIAQINAAFNRMSANLGRMSKVSRTVATAVGAVNRATGQYAAGTKKAAKATDQFNKQIGKISGGVDRLARAMDVVVAYGAAATIIYQLGNAFRASAAEIVEFDQALKNLEAITQATEGEISAMRDKIIEIATSTRFTSSEIADGMTIIGQAGFSAAEALKVVNATANLATGTLTDIKNTADLVTTAIRAFNLTAEDAARVSDVMANAINGSKLTMDKLRTAFNYVGAAASQVGLSLEQTASLMMMLANNGLRASTIGTGLRQVLSRLISPSRRLREAFKLHGIALEEISLKTNDLQTVMKHLGTVLWDSQKQTVDMGKAFQLFGLRGAQAAAVLVKSFVMGQYTEAIDKVYEVGTAARMAAIQAEGLVVKLDNLADTYKALAVEIGDRGIKQGLGLFIDSTQALGEGLIWVTKTVLGDFITQLTVTTALIGGTVGAVRLLWMILKASTIGQIIASWATAAYAAGGAFGVLTAAIRTLLGPIGLAITGAGLLITIMSKLANKHKEAAKEAEKQATQAAEVAGSIEFHMANLDRLHPKVSKSIEDSKEYNAELQRLQTVLSEAGESVNVFALSHDQLKNAMEQISISKRHEELTGYAKVVGENTQELDNMYSTYSKVNTVLNGFGSILGITEGNLVGATLSMDEYVKVNDEAAKVAGKSNKAFTSLVGGLADLKFQGKLTNAQIMAMTLTWERFGYITGEQGNKIRTATNEIFAKMVQAAKDAQTQLEVTVQQLPPKYQQMLSELSALEKIDFAEWIGRMNERLAKTEQMLDAMVQQNILSETEKNEALDKLRNEELEKFKEELLEKETMAEKHARRMYEIEAELRKEKLDLMDDSVEKFRKQMELEIEVFEKSKEAERMTAEQVAEKIAIITEQYNRKITQFMGRQLQDRIRTMEQEAQRRQAIIDQQLARERISAERASQEKLEIEKRLLEQVIAAWGQRMVELGNKYGLDSEAYKDALNQKREAEIQLQRIIAQMIEVQNKIKEAAKKRADESVKATEKQIGAENRLQGELQETARAYEGVASAAAMTPASPTVVGRSGGGGGSSSGSTSGGTGGTSDSTNAWLNQVATRAGGVSTYDTQTGKSEYIVKPDPEAQRTLDYLNKGLSELTRAIETKSTYDYHTNTTYGPSGSTGSASQESLGTYEGSGTTIKKKRFGGFIRARLGTFVGSIGNRLGTTFRGMVPGVGTGDKIPILAEPGEFVLRRDAVKKYGISSVDALNKGRIPESVFKPFKKATTAISSNLQKSLEVPSAFRKKGESEGEYLNRRMAEASQKLNVWGKGLTDLARRNPKRLIEEAGGVPLAFASNPNREFLNKVRKVAYAANMAVPSTADRSGKRELTLHLGGVSHTVYADSINLGRLFSTARRLGLQE